MKGKSAINETFQELCKALPKGFAKTVAERLEATGYKTSPRNVQYVANGQTSNTRIEEELLKLLDEKINTKFESQVKEKLAILNAK
jgi:hypothetical protein